MMGPSGLVARPVGSSGPCSSLASGRGGGGGGGAGGGAEPSGRSSGIDTGRGGCCSGRQGSRLVARPRRVSTVRCSATSSGGSVLCTYYAAPLHSKPGHPEGPPRVESILERLRGHRWPDGEGKRHPPLKAGPASSREGPCLSSTSTTHLTSRTPPSHLLLLESCRAATPAELSLVHPPGYVAAIRAACEKLREPALVDDSTYLAPGSYEECRRSVGAALDALDALLRPPTAVTAVANVGDGGVGRGGSCSSSSGPYAAAFALVRPPGHHVLPKRPMGFGVFNTVSVAARYARETYGIEKIAIVDFDVHHGNGTADIFYDDPYTLYISTHQAGLWPYTGKARETGSGAGRGACLNIPLPGGSGDAAVRLTWESLVLPSLESFRPDLLLVSAGFDAHWRDPLAGMQLTPGGYHWMSTQLRAVSQRWCPGRLALVLEGGYDLTSLSESVVASLEGLLGAPATTVAPPAVRDLYDEPMTRVEAAIKEVRHAHGQ